MCVHACLHACVCPHVCVCVSAPTSGIWGTLRHLLRDSEQLHRVHPPPTEDTPYTPSGELALRRDGGGRKG